FGVAALILSAVVPIASARSGSATPGFGDSFAHGRRDVSRGHLDSARLAAGDARLHPRPTQAAPRTLRGRGNQRAGSRPTSGVALGGSTQFSGQGTSPSALVVAPDVAVAAQWPG